MPVGWESATGQYGKSLYLVIGDILYMKHIPKCTYCENR
jgi:hypothetical protein